MTILIPLQKTFLSYTDKSLSEYLHPFLTQLDSVKSRKDYKGDLRLFGDFVQKPVHEVTPIDIINYRKAMEERGLAQATICKRLSVVRSFYFFLNQTFGLPNPALAVKLPRITDQSIKSVLSLSEVSRLLSSVNTGTIIGKRDIAILGLMLVNGLRSIEVSRANIEDIHFVEDVAVLKVHGKGGKIATAKLRKDVYEVIQTYLTTQDNSGEGNLFKSIGNLAKGRISEKTVQARVKHYLQLAGLNRPNLSSHSLRHTAATLTLSVGADMLGVQRMLRHSSMNTTLRYVQSLDELKNSAVDLNPVSLEGIV